MAEKDIRQYTAADLKKMGQSAKAVPTGRNAPEYHLDEDFWANAHVVMPGEEGKERISFRVDRDVLAWFRERGRGYQTRMNAVLRTFVDTRRQGPK